ALAGSRYCGLEAHQALSNIDSDRVEDLARIGEQPPPEQEEALEDIAEELAHESPEEVPRQEGEAPGEEGAEVDDEALAVDESEAEDMEPEAAEEPVAQPVEGAPGEAAEGPKS